MVAIAVLVFFAVGLCFVYLLCAFEQGGSAPFVALFVVIIVLFCFGQVVFGKNSVIDKEDEETISANIV